MDFLNLRRAGLPVSYFAIVLLLSSCGGSETVREPAAAPAYRYAPIAEMSDVRISAPLGALTVLCPIGWRETADQKNAPNIIAWLVRDDYAASISFTPLAMNPALYKTLQKDGLPAIAKVSMSLKKQQATDSVSIIRPPEMFTLNTRSFAAYEYSVDRGRTVIRVVVFDSGRQFLECALLPATSSLSAEEHRRLFETQQAVLASMVLP